MALLFKIILILLLLFIIFNLAHALVKMVKEPTDDGEDKPSMSYYLGRRVMFSALVVILLLIALTSGLIEPNTRPY
ncbi:DUF2909 family protein [uncultured Vibrio sp.]|uniref:DUF2909 family protein n=1 Tax=uncultured Vibrio sp. TaxID=114054 RepID=UPI0025DB6D76|nr:DUF2909 family protein [uncultured Vibrio sp.]